MSLNFTKKNQVPYESLKTNPPLEATGLNQSQYLESLDKFRLSPSADSMTPNPTVMQWLQTSGHLYRHIVLTARPHSTVEPASKFVFRHFSKWVRTFAFVPSRQSENPDIYDRSKADYLKHLGKVDYFIDDSLDNVTAVSQLDVKSLLVWQPWSPSGLHWDALLKEITP